MKQGPDVLFNTSSGRRILMDPDDEFDERYDGTSNVSRTDKSMADKSGTESGLDPIDIANPVSAYFFLSDDAQDEISGSDKKSMKCHSCGQSFTGEIYDSCPECFSLDIEKTADEKDDGYW